MRGVNFDIVPGNVVGQFAIEGRLDDGRKVLFNGSSALPLHVIAEGRPALILGRGKADAARDDSRDDIHMSVEGDEDEERSPLASFPRRGISVEFKNDTLFVKSVSPVTRGDVTHYFREQDIVMLICPRHGSGVQFIGKRQLNGFFQPCIN